MYGIIYKLTNKLNGKSYIGKTYDLIENRIIGHLYDAKKDRCKDRPLYRAINKYGAENFLVTILGYFSEEVLEEKEIELIELYNTYKEGYNATLGGDSRRRLSFTKEDIQKAISSTASTKAAARYLKVDSSTITRYAAQFKVPLKVFNSRLSKAKLTIKQVLEIRSSKKPGTFFVKKFNISKQNVSCIRNYKSWKNI